MLAARCPFRAAPPHRWGMTTLPDIGLVGLARAGKDTLASFLVEEGPFVRVAYADALKAAALDVDPVVTSPAPAWRSGRLSEVVAAAGWEEAKAIDEVRRFLQAFGVSVRDHVDPDAWVHAAARTMIRAEGPVVVTDVRFPNEAQAIRDRGGLIVKVVRPGAGLQGAAADHPSERLVQDIETPRWLTVTNDGGLQTLRARALSLLSDLTAYSERNASGA